MKRGFIALTVVIIVSVILLALVSTSNLAAYFGRFASLGSEEHERALALAEGCEQLALLKLAQNASYDPSADPSYLAGKGVPSTLGNTTCYIKDVVQLSVSGTSKVIELDTWAQDQQAFAALSSSVQLSGTAAPRLLATLKQ